jgi:hypothetical protein
VEHYGPSFQPSSLGVRLGQQRLQDHTGTRKSSGRDPPWHPTAATSLAMFAPAFLRVRRQCLLRLTAG